jgi:transcriptional regulator with XRE-family HTH domain
MSALRRSAEEWVAEDWSAVARAINQRADELGMTQRGLAERSQVSPAIIREIQQDKIHRRRNTKTLEALSVALDWHPEHLAAVLEGREPLPQHDGRSDEVPARLTAIERHLRSITRQLSVMNDNLESLRSDDQRRR